MITIEAIARINNHNVTWVFEGKDEETAEQNAKQQFSKNGLTYIDYTIL